VLTERYFYVNYSLHILYILSEEGRFAVLYRPSAAPFRACLNVLAAKSATSALEKALADNTPGAGTQQTDLNITPLDVNAKGMPPCLMWADNGSALLVLDRNQGALLRFAEPRQIDNPQAACQQDRHDGSYGAGGLARSRSANYPRLE
jgi:hypothetical protein